MAWVFSKDIIIKQALRKIGQLEEGESPSPEQIDSATDSLNLIIDQLGETDGVRLWKKETASESLTSGVATFTLGTDVLDVEKVYVRDSSGNDFPVNIINSHEYADIHDKDTAGQPENVWLNFGISGESSVISGTLYPVPETTYTLKLIVNKSLARMDSGDDIPDVPKRWYPYLIWKLASDLAPEAGHAFAYQQKLDNNAEKAKRSAMTKEMEDSDTDFIESAY